MSNRRRLRPALPLLPGFLVRLPAPLPVSAAVLRVDYKTLPAYSTSFFPLAYAACGKHLPAEADRKLRATMNQADDGYLNDHIAATFHAVHYYRLLGVRTPRAGPML